MTDEELVRSFYPDADCVTQNNGFCYVRDVSGSKMQAGVKLSDRFRRESDAWHDAAMRLTAQYANRQGGKA